MPFKLLRLRGYPSRENQGAKIKSLSRKDGIVQGGNTVIRDAVPVEVPVGPFQRAAFPFLNKRPDPRPRERGLRNPQRGQRSNVPAILAYLAYLLLVVVLPYVLRLSTSYGRYYRGPSNSSTTERSGLDRRCQKTACLLWCNSCRKTDDAFLAPNSLSAKARKPT